MRPTQIAILLATFLILACGHNHPESQHGKVEHGDQPSNSSTPQAILDGIELNDGRKWPMDDHTRSTFAKMATSFLDSNTSSLAEEGLRQAGSNLQLDIQDLIKGCTMTGPAHDQLHVFLTGFMPAVGELSKTGTRGDAEKVEHYLKNYGDYFE